MEITDYAYHDKIITSVFKLYDDLVTTMQTLSVSI